MMVPLFVNEPLLPAVRRTPTAPVPTLFEIVPLFITELLESIVTAAPIALVSTEPADDMVMLPGLALAAVAVATALVVLVVMLRLSERAGETAKIPTALHTATPTRKMAPNSTGL